MKRFAWALAPAIALLGPVRARQVPGPTQPARSNDHDMNFRSPQLPACGRPPEAVVRRPALKECTVTLTILRTLRRPEHRRLLSRLPDLACGSGTTRRLAVA
jgi:hypothetical protein